MIRNKTTILYILLIGLFACNTSTITSRYDYTYLYDEDQKVINPKFKLFHSSKDSSTLFFELNSKDILYSRINEDTSSIARIWIKYLLYADKNKNTVVDSTTIPLINYGSNESDKLLQAFVKLKIPFGKEYFLEIRFRDANKDLNVVHRIKIDKRKNNNDQFFLIKDLNNVVVFGQTLPSKHSIRLIKSPLIENNQFTLERIKHSFGMTPPPFVDIKVNELELDLDSSSQINFVQNEVIINNAKSVNFLRSDDSLAGFCYFFHFHDGFPEITLINQLIQPVRYISTSKEFKTLKAGVNPKKELDAFWLRLGMNEQRAKEMIKEYYTRIENANLFFSTYKEGWKTDRGIIYVIYGKPTTIYKSESRETWIYGEENNLLSVKFEFHKKVNSESRNDFQMARNPEYKNNWYRAVDLWRQAKVY